MGRLCQREESSDQRLESMRWYFGDRQCRSITLAADDSDHGVSFELNTINKSYEEVKYVIFLDDGITVAPTVSTEQTLISVSVVAGETANAKAVSIEAALVAAEVLVQILITDGMIEIQNSLVGGVTTEAAPSLSTIAIEVGFEGFGGYIGQTGESEMTTTTDFVEILDDAQGSVTQDEIIVGQGVEITIPLREMTTERWQDLVGRVTGNTVEINGENITGYGTSKLYQSMFLFSGRLVGHPIRLPNDNTSEDITMLNTAPKMNSINFSGGSIQEAEFMFKAYRKAGTNEGINLLARGDHTLF